MNCGKTVLREKGETDKLKNGKAEKRRQKLDAKDKNFTFLENVAKLKKSTKRGLYPFEVAKIGNILALVKRG